MNERIVAAGVVAVVLAGIVGLFFLTHEKREVTVFTPASDEARRNPLLAAQRLLSELGYSVETQQQFAPSLTLPPADATAVLRSNYAYLDDDEMDALLDWVAGGGHLIVEIDRSPPDDIDPIFTPLGVSARVRSDPIYNAAKNRRDADASTQPDTPASAATPDREAWGDVWLDNNVTIELGSAQPIRTVFDQFGVFAAQLRYDAGRVTAVADLEMLRNELIADADHAFMLTQLLDPADTSGPVWLVNATNFPSLWSLLTQRIGVVMLAGVATVLMSLWWASQRFGPLVAPPASARKAFIEHIEAAGRFLWRAQRDEGLLTETRHALLTDARRRHPPLRHGDDQQHVRYLAELCGVSQGHVSDALFDEPTGRSGDFTRRVQMLQALWKKL